MPTAPPVNQRTGKPFRPESQTYQRWQDYQQAPRPSVDLSARRTERNRIQARYDAAATTSDNKNYWANADSLSANAAASSTVRKTLRIRGRYEVTNNSYAMGMGLTLANYIIGTGPRLQMMTEDHEINREVEKEWHTWTSEIGLAEKLRTMRMSRYMDGEGFGRLIDNPELLSPVKLDFRLVEADRVTTPDISTFGNLSDTDGIRYDEYGNVISYLVLKQHPGSNLMPAPTDYDLIMADDMIHSYKAIRPGQDRGVPEITPALPLFSQLRRYTLAVIAAAESVADQALVLFTEALPDGEADPVDPLDEIELERRMMTTLPAGWKMGQVKAEQPSSTYKEFKAEILNEIARCLNMPYNVAVANSSGYNYASGRLDHQTFFRSIRVERHYDERVILDRILRAWLWEWWLVGQEAPPLSLPPHQWFWDGFEHVDPMKEAKAEDTKLKNGSTNQAIVQAKSGRDWQDVQRQNELEETERMEATLRLAARRKEYMEELGLSGSDIPSNDEQPTKTVDELEEEIDEREEDENE